MTEKLEDINLKLNRDEKILIVGPSGSGKTTLLRSINGLEKIDQGSISFDSEKIDNYSLNEIRKKTGMIFQEFNLVNNIKFVYL